MRDTPSPLAGEGVVSTREFDSNSNEAGTELSPSPGGGGSAHMERSEM